MANKYREFFNNGKYKMESNGAHCRIISLTSDYKYKVKNISKEDFYDWAYKCYIREVNYTIKIISLEEGLQKINVR